MDVEIYQYKSVTHSDTIRVLYLYPNSDFDAPVLCGIEEARLSSKPRYTAISYTWATEDGDASRSCSINLGGSSLAITKNLHDALRYVRCDVSDVPLCLWIDAVCINQEDDDEKSVQVALMGRIYKQAYQVIAWLGKGATEREDQVTDIATRCLYEDLSLPSQAVNSRKDQRARLHLRHTWTLYPFNGDVQDNGGEQWCTICTEWFARQSPWPELRFHWECDEQYILQRRNLRLSDEEVPRDGKFWWYDEQYEWSSTMKTELVDALKKLLLRRYWSRRWIVQEINLPCKESIVFRWASYSIPYAALDLILDFEEGWYFARELPRAMMRNFRNQDIFALVHAAKGIHCSEPRDTLYALLGPAENVPFSADYRRSPIDVFVDFARLAILHGKLAQTLSESCGSVQYYDEFSVHLPSWVLDWRGSSPNPIVPDTRTPNDGQHLLDNTRILKVELYINGVCHYPSHHKSTGQRTIEQNYTAEQTTTPGCEAAGNSSTAVSQPTSPSPRSWLDKMWDTYTPENNRETPLWESDPSETDAMIYPWPHADNDSPVDAILTRQAGTPSEGDLLFSTTLPSPSRVFEFEDDFSHTLATLFLRRTDASMTRFRICGHGTIQYREGAEQPQVLHELELE